MSRRRDATITIDDVARLAAVSTQTVSRVINSAPNVRAETRARVTLAIEKLHYYPNRSAQNLQKQTVRAIGIGIPFATEQIKRNPFYAEVISAVNNECSHEGFTLNVTGYDTEKKDVKSIVRLYKERVISGIILTSPDIEDATIMELRFHAVPFVVIGRPGRAAGVTYVDTDNKRMAFESTEHLFELGHRRILLVNGPAFMTYSEDLLAGYGKAHRAHGLPVDEELVVETNLLEDDALAREPELSRRLEGATAAFTANDQLALALVKILADSGRGVPDDFSIIAGSDSFWAPFVTPSLTTVSVDYATIGRTATQLLLRMVLAAREPPEPTQVIFPARIVERGSCRRIAAANR